MKVKIVILTLAVVGLTFCKAKKSADTASTTTTTTTPVVAENTISKSLQDAAEVRYPGIALVDLQEGQKLYNGKCGKCHDLPAVAAYTEERWPKLMAWMAPKANMDDAQREKTLKYVLAARDIAIRK